MQQSSLNDFFSSSSSTQKSLNDFFSTPRASSVSTANMFNDRSKTTPRRRPRLKTIGNSASAHRPRFKQMIIDAGQKNIGLEHCVQCGMIYSLNEPKDVEQHLQFHNRFTETRNFRVTANQIETWKKLMYNETVAQPIDGSLFLLKSTSTSTLKRKFENVLTDLVNDELGYSAELPIWDQEGRRRALVLIANSNGSQAPFICGILLVDIVEEVTVMPQQKHFKGTFLGVDRIWVHSRLRRKGIATFLLDTCRRIFAPKTDKEVARTRVAFGDPSDLGKKLAINYVGGKENGRYIIYSPKGHVKDKTDLLAQKLGV